MPAHRAEAARTTSPPIPLGGVVLMLVAIVAICLLAVTAANSSIEQFGGPTVGGPVITPDDPAAPTVVPVQILDR
jgi:hypothetical protein